MKEVTLADLMELAEEELLGYAKELDLPIPSGISKFEIAERIMGKKCFGCGKT